MIDIIHKELDELREIYLLANTPGQIYRWFRESKILSDLAVKENEQELIEQYTARSNKEERTIDDVVIAYAILVVISFFEYGEGKLLLEKLDLSKLQWAEDLKRIYFQAVIPTIYIIESGKATRLEDIALPKGIKTEYFASSGKALLEIERKDINPNSVSFELVDVKNNKRGEEE